MSLEKGAHLGPYEIVEPIGAGGMGEVYRATDPRIGREVAIKVLPSGLGGDPTRLRRFEQEARAAGALNHPNLLTIHDIGHADGVPYLVTELLEGETLRDRLGASPVRSGSTDSSGVSPRRVVDWGVQIANGLAAAHEAGIVHRDLKPENIFITRDGRVKILDFGLAKLLGSFEGREEDATVQRGTDPGTVMGTTAYMSPEQVRGENLDHRSDLFSLGVILYELASGRRAFLRETKPETMTAILREDPEDLALVHPSTPPALVRIIDHCLEKHPEQRFQSARDLAFHLKAISESSSHAEVGMPPRRSFRPGWGIAAAVALLALVFGFFAGRVTSRDEGKESGTTSSATALRTLTFSGKDAEPAVSPDGKLMAFSSERDGVSRIWIKQLQGGGELALTGGVDRMPRFNPDGATLLFIREEKAGRSSVYKVPLLGGEPRKLIDGAIGADWSPDGESIVFTRVDSSGDVKTEVHTASSDGSDQKRIGVVEGRVISFPRWSPDGKAIALADVGGGNYDYKPLIINLADGQVRSIDIAIEANMKPAVDWIDANRIIVAAIPGATNIVTGSGSVLVEYDLRTDQSRVLLYVPAPVLTVEALPDGRVAFDTTPVRQNLAEVSLADGRERWLSRGTSIDRQPAYSPDGKEVIFSSNMSGNLDLWVISMEDGSLRRLTDDAADDFDPVYSHDGREIYWSSRRVTGHYEIWAASADGSGARQVSRDGFDAENPTPTPDGRWIVYNSYNPEKTGLWKIRTDGSEATHLVKIDSQLPEVSPDGEYASFHVISATDLRVVRLSDGEVFPLADTVLPFNAVIVPGRSRWKPGSRVVVFVDFDEEGLTGLWEQPFEPGRDTRDQRRKLAGFERGQLAESFGFAPDGRTLTIAKVDQVDSIMMSDPIPALLRQ